MFIKRYHAPYMTASFATSLFAIRVALVYLTKYMNFDRKMHHIK